MIKFQYYNNNSKDPEPLGFVTIKSFLNSIKNPKPSTVKIIDDIKAASLSGDRALKDELKRHLYSFTPCVHVKSRRAYADITEFTGLTVLDFDKINYVDEFKAHLFETYSSVIAAWVSPSGKGVKAFVKIPKVKTIENYKKYFYGLASEMEIYNGFDATTQNAVLPLFIGYDRDILIRDDYTEWNIKGSKVNEFTPVANVPIEKATGSQKDWVINWFTGKINDICDNGHPQVIASCLTLGGYVGSGYIDIQDAINLSINLISSNSYLQKGVSGYLKTADSAIKLGTTKPLTFS